LSNQQRLIQLKATSVFTSV